MGKVTGTAWEARHPVRTAASTRPRRRNPGPSSKYAIDLLGRQLSNSLTLSTEPKAPPYSKAPPRKSVPLGPNRNKLRYFHDLTTIQFDDFERHLVMKPTAYVRFAQDTAHLEVLRKELPNYQKLEEGEIPAPLTRVVIDKMWDIAVCYADVKCKKRGNHWNPGDEFLVVWTDYALIKLSGQKWNVHTERYWKEEKARSTGMNYLSNAYFAPTPNPEGHKGNPATAKQLHKLLRYYGDGDIVKGWELGKDMIVNGEFLQPFYEPQKDKELRSSLKLPGIIYRGDGRFDTGYLGQTMNSEVANGQEKGKTQLSMVVDAMEDIAAQEPTPEEKFLANLDPVDHAALRVEGLSLRQRKAALMRQITHRSDE